ERLNRKSSRSLLVQLWSIFTSKEVAFFLSCVFNERLLERAVDCAAGTSVRIFSAIALNNCEGILAQFVPAAWMPCAFGTTGLPAASHCNCVRPVPSGLPLNGLYIGLPPADRSPPRNAPVGTVTRLNCPRTSLM